MDETGSPADKLKLALELADLGQKMMLQNLRRAYPSEDESQVLARLQEWMRSRPGAEHGDSWGRPVSWPRYRK